MALKADFYADVWAHYETKYNQNGIKLDRADIDSSLVAAYAIGDDGLQHENGGSVRTGQFYAWHFCAADVLVQKRV